MAGLCKQPASADQGQTLLQMTAKQPAEQLDALEVGTPAQQAEIERLRQSEQRYQDIFENANDLIHATDNEGKILYANRLWRETLGYTAEDIKELKIFDVIDARYQGKCIIIFNRLMQGEKLAPTETIFLTKDGREILVEGRCNPTLQEGKAVELMGIFRDITARRQLEQEKEQLITELKEALARVRTLEGCLPICASCKQIRDEQGGWNQIESYIKAHSATEFSHSICPACAKRLYPEFT